MSGITPPDPTANQPALGTSGNTIAAATAPAANTTTMNTPINGVPISILCLNIRRHNTPPLNVSTDNDEIMASTGGSLWTLFCQAVDHKNQRLGSVFHVFIAPSAIIGYLKKEIFNKVPSGAQKPGTRFNSNDLQLWKLSTPISARSSIIRRAFANLDFSNLESDDETDDEHSDDAPKV
ncbi:hypothetical protein BJV78DRAFT_216867 [Lactifluus subvellereus]|nr:hypothetical protein BJV78DRAFT_216867 [Lactifluus subvellereus]